MSQEVREEAQEGEYEVENKKRKKTKEEEK